MGSIALEGMLFRSFIGVHAFEQESGNNFEVDVLIESENISGDSDHLADTIDYNDIYFYVQQIMSNRYHLIEHAAHELLQLLVKNLLSAIAIEVKISKLHPPLSGEVRKASTLLKWNRAR